MRGSGLLIAGFVLTIGLLAAGPAVAAQDATPWSGCRLTEASTVREILATDAYVWRLSLVWCGEAGRLRTVEVFGTDYELKLPLSRFLGVDEEESYQRGGVGFERLVVRATGRFGLGCFGGWDMGPLRVDDHCLEHETASVEVVIDVGIGHAAVSCSFAECRLDRDEDLGATRD